jgi:hypothetical protein
VNPLLSKPEQIIITHDSRDPLNVDNHSSRTQLCGDSPIAVAPLMLHHNIVDRGSQRHFLLGLPSSP